MATPQDLPPSPEMSGAAAPPSLLQILWGRKALIVLGAVVGVTIGALYFAQRKPVYESSAKIMVERKAPEVAVPGYESFGFAEDYLATQIEVLHTIIVTKAVKDQELGRLRSFQGMSEPEVVGSIRGSLKVNREAQQNGSTGPSTLDLVYRGADPDDCRDVLAAIISSYQRFLDERYHKSDRETTQHVLDKRDELKKDLKGLYADEQKLLDEGPLMIGKDGVTVQETELGTLHSRLSALKLQRGELGSKIEQLEQAIRTGQDTALLIEATEGKAFGGGAALSGAMPVSETNIDVQLMPQLLRLRDLESRYGSGYPDVRDLRNQIEAAREILKSANVSSRRSTFPAAPHERAILNTSTLSIGLLATPGEQGPLLAAVGVASTRLVNGDVIRYLQLLKAQQHDAEMTLLVLQEMGDRESKVVHSLAGFRNQLANLRKDIADKEQYQFALTKLLNDRKTQGGSGGYVATALVEPGQGGQIEPRPTPIFTVALLLGLAAGVALAWVAEATDKSFRTPDEVRRRLGLPVVGHVPRILPDPEAQRQHEAGTLALDPSICAFYQSKSLEAEAFRGIRTTLYFSAQNEGCKIIQVTSPNMGDGKTTLATNLAVSIAQSGKKILLIDADFRRPKLHRMFGVRARTGLATVIQDDTELSDAIQPTAVPNLSLLPCGPRPSNPAELLTSPRFREVLETLRDKFDLILVDTPPLLAVSDPSVVASQVDGVLMTIRVSKNGRPAAERARDILASIEANILGIIVNGIGNRGQEGYGAAHYGYQYQYQYAYEPTDNRSYYQDGEPESQVHKNGAATANGFDDQAAADAAPVDPDVVEIGVVPVGSEAARPRERIPGTRRKTGHKPGVVAGLTKWLRTTLWH